MEAGEKKSVNGRITGGSVRSSCVTSRNPNTTNQLQRAEASGRGSENGKPPEYLKPARKLPGREKPKTMAIKGMPNRGGGKGVRLFKTVSMEVRNGRSTGIRDVRVLLGRNKERVTASKEKKQKEKHPECRLAKLRRDRDLKNSPCEIQKKKS